MLCIGSMASSRFLFVIEGIRPSALRQRHGRGRIGCIPMIGQRMQWDEQSDLLVLLEPHPRSTVGNCAQLHNSKNYMQPDCVPKMSILHLHAILLPMLLRRVFLGSLSSQPHLLGLDHLEHCCGPALKLGSKAVSGVLQFDKIRVY